MYYPFDVSVLCITLLDVSALTSAVMKVCERVVLCKLEKLVKDYIDPLQFAYRKNRSTDDAFLYSLENIYSHLEKKQEVL